MKQKTYSLNVEIEPSTVPVGTAVRLSTTKPSENHEYLFTWRVTGLKCSETLTEHDPEAMWSTSGRVPGAYKAEVEATLDPPDQQGVPAGASFGQGSKTFVISERPVSFTDVSNMIFGENVTPQSIKDNIDEKMNRLAAAVREVGGRLPGQVPVNDDEARFPKQAIPVALERSRLLNADLRDLGAFFGAIRNRTEAISFPRYNEFINRLLCTGSDDANPACSHATLSDTANNYGSPSIASRRADLEARPTIYGVDAYTLLKLATEAFLVFEAGIVVQAPRSEPPIIVGDTRPVPGEASHLGEDVTFGDITDRLTQYLTTGRPTYLQQIVEGIVNLQATGGQVTETLPYCDGVLRRRFNCPSLLELIWSYWLEEGMQVQTLNAITLRFQNRRGATERDPLANLALDPLRPLNNLLWGYIQDETNRLSLPRRAYEYDHHYGLTLYGRAVPKLQSADSRSKFLNAFHSLLNKASIFYHDDADTTVIADAFPLLNSLREVHLILAEGAHNQFGDLPWTARVEMLIQQYLLARGEMREFLRGRAMVPYQEAWMGQVDTMKKLQGWTDVNITNFFELATFGEQVLLSVRYHDWSSAATGEDEAKLWARYWKNEIQRYIHSYRAVTGVDLTVEPVDVTPPWVHLSKRLAEEQRRRAGRP